MRAILVAVVLPLVLCQQPYGLSQLDNYARLVNSGNLGGMGPIQAAVANGQVRSLSDLDGSSKLSGLPPLPPTDEELKRQLTSTSPTPTPRPTARPTSAAPVPLPVVIGPYHVDPQPEMPPMPEEKLKGRFDDDGNFVPFTAAPEEKSHVANNKIQGTRIHELNAREKRKDDIEDYESDDFYDDPALHLTSQNKESTPVKTTVVRVQPKLIQQQTQQHGAALQTPEQRLPPVGQRPLHEQVIQNPTLNLQQQSPLQVANQPQFMQAVVPVTQPSPRFPSFVYRPKPKAVGREAYFDNVLQEIEEYDDFLEQQRTYREQFPYARLPVNPYVQLHPGQLLPPIFQRGVTIDNTGYVKPLDNHEFIGTFDGKTPVVQQPFKPQPVQQAVQQPIQQQNFQQTQQQLPGLNPFQQQQSSLPVSATEHPLLNLLRIFDVHHSPHFGTTFPQFG